MTTLGIEELTVPALSLALDAAVMRQQVIANNIANAHTVGFQARSLSFETVIASADTAKPDAAVSLALQPRLSGQTVLSIDGAVRLDSEVAAMAQNGAHYQALLRALNRHMSILASAVSEGKR